MEFCVKIWDSPRECSSALAKTLEEHLLRGGAAVLGGGETPKETYRLLAQRPLPWHTITLTPSDERLLPESSPRRNDAMLYHFFGRRGCKILSLARGETPRKDADFTREIRRLTPFRTVLLGLGEDGHTASLFLDSREERAGTLLHVHNSPKAPSERISLPPEILGATEHLFFCVIGQNKQKALKRLLAGELLPPQRIPLSSPAIIFADRDAAGETKI